jgi:3',5'-cyclic AMP phosphodiesterase CpdA
MRTLVHLSDLHFGRIDEATLDPLLRTVHGLAPHAVVVSGDLTQRAKARQFRAARAFLDRLPTPQVVVPGNHDVPLYRVWERFLSPLGKYRRWISEDLEPAWMDEEIAIVGVNTARSLTFKGGRINEAQVEALRRRLAPLGEGVTKVVVTHHPFDLPDRPDDDDELVGRARLAMEAFSRCGVDLLLAGHLHTSESGSTEARYRLPGYAALAVQAGTATSTRGRGEENAFNVLRIANREIELERYGWKPAAGAFVAAGTERFRRDGQRWVELGSAAGR